MTYLLRHSVLSGEQTNDHQCRKLVLYTRMFPASDIEPLKLRFGFVHSWTSPNKDRLLPMYWSSLVKTVKLQAICPVFGMVTFEQVRSRKLRAWEGTSASGSGSGFPEDLLMQGKGITPSKLHTSQSLAIQTPHYAPASDLSRGCLVLAIPWNFCLSFQDMVAQ